MNYNIFRVVSPANIYNHDILKPIIIINFIHQKTIDLILD